MVIVNAEMEAVADYEPHFSGLLRAVYRGAEDFRKANSFLAGLGRVPNDRAKTTLLNSLVVQRVQEEFAEDEVLKYDDDFAPYDTFRIGEGNLFVLKKGRGGIAVNHDSQRQRDLRRRQMWFGFGDARWLVVLYEMDRVLAYPTNVLLVSPKGFTKNHWEFSILEAVRKLGRLPQIVREAEATRRKAGG